VKVSDRERGWSKEYLVGGSIGCAQKVALGGEAQWKREGDGKRKSVLVLRCKYKEKRLKYPYYSFGCLKKSKMVPGVLRPDLATVG